MFKKIHSGYFLTKTNFMKNSDVFYGTVIKPYNSWSDIKMSAEAVRIQTSMTGGCKILRVVRGMTIFD